MDYSCRPLYNNNSSVVPDPSESPLLINTLKPTYMQVEISTNHDRLVLHFFILGGNMLNVFKYDNVC